MLHHDLLARARAGLDGRGRLRSVFVRRAISDAYYALFHAMADMCANSLVGSTRRKSEAWRRVYRTLDHGQVREELRRSNVGGINSRIGSIALDFARLQDARQVADYDPAPVYRHRRDAVALLSVAEDAISAIEALPPTPASSFRRRWRRREGGKARI